MHRTDSSKNDGESLKNDKLKFFLFQIDWWSHCGVHNDSRFLYLKKVGFKHVFRLEGSII